jgi:uncharacterized protein (DUF2249 family)
MTPRPISSAPHVPEPRPAALAEVSPAQRVSLDVRPVIGRGEEPFATIMAAAADLGADQILVVRTPFEPIPLYRALGRRGFAHWTERHADDDWSVWFYRGDSKAASVQHGAAAGDTLDVRGLEPPQPMVAVLERLETLAPGETLTVVHDRRPTFLYPQLDDRGFTHRTDEPSPGVVRIMIGRRAS